MKTRIVLFIVLILAFVLPGCVYSLYPIYTDNDLVYDNKLEGVWSSYGDKNVWKFENLLQHELAPYKDKAERAEKEKFKKTYINSKTYLLSYTEKGDTRSMYANIARLGDNMFLDLFPDPNNLKDCPFEDQYVPVHTYAKLKMIGNRLEFYFFDSEFLYKLLDQNTARIKHESFNDYKIITASTDELQKFVVKYANKKELFMAPMILNKTPGN